MTEECPNCETDLLVGGGQGPYYRWQCHGCGEQWGQQDRQPIPYDAVEQWFESRASEGKRLHTNRECPQTTALFVHTPTEARDCRHGRCLTCGHEVVKHE